MKLNNVTRAAILAALCAAPALACDVMSWDGGGPLPKPGNWSQAYGLPTPVVPTAKAVAEIGALKAEDDFESVSLAVGDVFRGRATTLTVKTYGTLLSIKDLRKPEERSILSQLKPEKYAELKKLVADADFATLPKSIDRAPNGPQDMPSVKLSATLGGKSYFLFFTEFDLSQSKFEKRLKPLVDALYGVQSGLEPKGK